MWVSGINCRSRSGYNIGTPMLNSCLTINDNGAVTADYKLRTPLVQIDTIRGNGSAYITVDDDVYITWFFNSNKSWNTITGNINLLDTIANYICWNNTGIASPSFTTRSLGTKLVVYPQITTASADYAIGVENKYLWFSTPSTTTAHRWYCGVSRVMELSLTGIVASGRIYHYQTTQTASITPGSTALTMAHLVNGIYQRTQTAAVLLPLPTGTLTHTNIIGGSGSTIAIDQSIDWSVIHIGSSLGAATVQATTAHTLIGSGLVAIGTSGRFRIRLSATNVAITYIIS